MIDKKMAQEEKQATAKGFTTLSSDSML